MKLLQTLGMPMLMLLLGMSVASAQSWTPLTNPPPFFPDTALLLTDGTIMVHALDGAKGYGTPNWWKLTPDINGSYVDGTWSQLASMDPTYKPLYLATAVLPDGRLIIEGGEYNGTSINRGTKGAIYDPVANHWTNVLPPTGWSSIGDAQSAILANGTFMLAACCGTTPKQSALLNSTALTWTITGTGKADINDEEAWTLLPSGKVLTVDTRNGTNSEIYDPSTGAWSSAGSTIVALAYRAELGPQILRYDGSVFATGANGAGAGHTSIYSAGTWTLGPDFPNGLDIADGPAAVLPDDNVL